MPIGDREFEDDGLTYEQRDALEKKILRDRAKAHHEGLLDRVERDGYDYGSAEIPEDWRDGSWTMEDAPSGEGAVPQEVEDRANEARRRRSDSQRERTMQGAGLFDDELTEREIQLIAGLTRMFLTQQ